MSVALRLAPAASRASPATRPVASSSACVIARLDCTCSASSEIAFPMSAAVRATASPPPRNVRAESVERLELARQARHGVEQRIPQVVDVQRRGQLVGEAAHEHRLLRSVRPRLVMLELEHAHHAIAETQADRHDRAYVRARNVDSRVPRRVIDDHRLACSRAPARAAWRPPARSAWEAGADPHPWRRRRRAACRPFA